MPKREAFGSFAKPVQMLKLLSSKVCELKIPLTGYSDSESVIPYS